MRRKAVAVAVVAGALAGAIVVSRPLGCVRGPPECLRILYQGEPGERTRRAFPGEVFPAAQSTGSCVPTQCLRVLP